MFFLHFLVDLTLQILYQSGAVTAPLGKKFYWRKFKMAAKILNFVFVITFVPNWHRDLILVANIMFVRSRNLFMLSSISWIHHFILKNQNGHQNPFFVITLLLIDIEISYWWQILCLWGQGIYWSDFQYHKFLILWLKIQNGNEKSVFGHDLTSNWLQYYIYLLYHRHLTAHSVYSYLYKIQFYTILYLGIVKLVQILYSI